MFYIIDMVKKQSVILRSYLRYKKVPDLNLPSLPPIQPAICSYSPDQ